MRLSANLSWLYRDLPWAQRFPAAAGDGFGGVEILLPYDEAPGWYARQLETSGVPLTLVNTPVATGAGRLGWAAVPGAEPEFRLAFDQARAVAAATGCRTVHVMAGDVAGLPGGDCASTLRRNLAQALVASEADGLVLTLEALNREDVPGYFYWHPAQVVEVLREFDSPRLRMQFDFYHCMKEDLDLVATVQACAPWIGYAQVAGVDGRHEPQLGQHALAEALTALRGSGYGGWLGCEYAPRERAAEGLAWCEPLRRSGVIA